MEYLIATLVLFVLIILGTGSGIPAPYVSRICQGKSWRKSFPNATKDEIREFLQEVINGFGFKKKDLLKLKPEDRILDVYKALYPQKWMADALEFETLAKGLQKKYGLSLESVWNEKLTFAELFEACQKNIVQQGV